MRTARVAGILLAVQILLAAQILLAVQAAAGVSLNAQQRRLPLAPIRPGGDEVAPFFEGWYRNDDGTFTLSFGFFNLNGEQILDIPLGSDNFIEPAEFHGMQPTHFPVRPRRDRGVFSVTVPDFYADGEQRVVWTITANGFANATPGRVGNPALQLDYGPRAMGSVPPMSCASAPTGGRASTSRACGRSRAPQKWGTAGAGVMDGGGLGARTRRHGQRGGRRGGVVVQASGARRRGLLRSRADHG